MVLGQRQQHPGEVAGCDPFPAQSRLHEEGAARALILLLVETQLAPARMATTTATCHKGRWTFRL